MVHQLDDEKSQTQVSLPLELTSGAYPSSDPGFEPELVVMEVMHNTTTLRNPSNPLSP